MALQDVKWDVEGFDDEGSSNAHFVSAADARLQALIPGRRFGGTEIPVVSRPSGGGGPLTAIDLDTLLPGDATAVPVFPITDGATRALSSTRALNARVAAPGVNLGLTRFVPPQAVEIVP